MVIKKPFVDPEGSPSHRGSRTTRETDQAETLLYPRQASQIHSNYAWTLQPLGECYVYRKQMDMEFSQDEYASLLQSEAHGCASHRSLLAPLADQERSRIAISDLLL